MPIETIPNPLQDSGVKKDIEEKVQELMKYQGGHRNVKDFIEDLVKQACEWGYSTGFRMGWRVYEHTGGKI